METRITYTIPKDTIESINGNGLIGFPSWIIKLTRRLKNLPHGRYQLILTIGQDCDWTVIELGKVESSKSD